MGAILDVAPKAARFLAARDDAGSVYGRMIDYTAKVRAEGLKKAREDIAEGTYGPEYTEYLRATIEAEKEIG